jgi:protocatechuate 3,4-dioxygenase beta subunit
MKLSFISRRRNFFGTAISLLAVFILAACSGQSPGSAAPAFTPSPSISLPQATPEMPQTPQAAIPITSTQGSSSQAGASLPTPACTRPAALTPSLTEGPYFKANSPERSSLVESGMIGTKLTLSGYVLTPDCKPVPHALLDFWQANAEGQYDNSGFTLRGHQFTDENGHYQLETIVPGLYPGRTVHIHVKVQAPNRPTLTTQLFEPGESSNQSDSIYDARLLMNVQNVNGGQVAVYNFVVSP